MCHNSALVTIGVFSRFFIAIVDIPRGVCGTRAQPYISRVADPIIDPLRCRVHHKENVAKEKEVAHLPNAAKCQGVAPKESQADDGPPKELEGVLVRPEGRLARIVHVQDRHVDKRGALDDAVESRGLREGLEP